ncbi:hypothetical protein K4A83_01055 [Spirulina subsalsa FACHB-351]|uniref:SPOR domain-containing protein n=1 Tax=Spirulina subsalsa FACHB-351 TaxID=234711 RepID=A0ABT3L036_9CYAN|nr:hypothetical protein [Spirulina subsalsa]MCW6034865.1 hypothetical protein [Spirulina subsalsa FACHB-351]
MAKNGSGQYSTPSGMSPVLESALSCLDVQLEEELARYRRQRTATPEPTPTMPPLTERVAAEVAFAPLRPDTEAAPTHALPSPEAPKPPLELESHVANLTQKGNPPVPDSDLPQDDLASSAQLRRNLAEGEKEPPLTPPRNRLLTPIGLGSMVLLGSALTLTAVAILEPERLSALYDRLFPAPDAPVATTPAPNLPPLTIQGPNLAQDEFGELNLDTLSTITANPSPTLELPNIELLNPSPSRPSAPPPPPPEETTDLTTALLQPIQPSPSPEASPSPSPAPSPEVSPSPSPASDLANDPVVVNAAPGPTTSDFYYVLVPYTGPSSLQQARSAIPDAYARRFSQGVQLQMGAFIRESDAKQLVERLEDQGITAQVYRP